VERGKRVRGVSGGTFSGLVRPVGSCGCISVIREWLQTGELLGGVTLFGGRNLGGGCVGEKREW